MSSIILIASRRTIFLRCKRTTATYDSEHRNIAVDVYEICACFQMRLHSRRRLLFTYVNRNISVSQFTSLTTATNTAPYLYSYVLPFTFAKTASYPSTILLAYTYYIYDYVSVVIYVDV